jgi:CRP-like cAMP-binding protein
VKDNASIAEVQSGDIFGEMSLLSHGPAVASIRAASKIYALVLPRADFQEVIMTHPQVLEYINTVADERRRDIDRGRVRVT